MADVLKAQGNKAFVEKNWDEAIAKFTEATEIDPKNHILYSNLSAAYSSKRDFKKAQECAQKCTELKPDFVKGWTRLGDAILWQANPHLIDALDAYDEALKLDSNNAAAKAGRDNVNRKMDEDARRHGENKDDFMGGFGDMFNDPNLRDKLEKNPKTKGLMDDPEFKIKLDEIKKNPNDIGKHLGDPRVMNVMAAMLGVDMSLGNPDAMAGQGTNMSADRDGDISMSDARPPPASAKKAPEPEPEPEPEDEEAVAKKQAKAKADEEKKLGTENYKKRQFDAAIEHYSKAWEIHKDIAYLTNKSAAEYEKGDYQGAIETCKTAITEGREVLADFKLIAKAFGRIGSAYEKLGDLANAIDNYQRSLTEHRTPDILTKLRAAEKAKSTSEKDAYINPEEAEKARELGNQKFKEADWPAAVEAYSEMIKRAPTDPRGYSNRAACFIKLLTFPSAVQDCDAALKLDENFIRAYLRKAQALFAMREYSRCVDVCAEAHTHDKEGANAREIQAQEQKALQAQFSAQEGETEEQTMERIQRDPEIMSILQDPVMQSILQQSKADPKALQEHMKDPRVRTNIQKLTAAGVIRMGR